VRSGLLHLPHGGERCLQSVSLTTGACPTGFGVPPFGQRVHPHLEATKTVRAAAYRLTELGVRPSYPKDKVLNNNAGCPSHNTPNSQ
jgi:hypothetical protein